MKTMGKSLREAYDFVKEKRSEVLPNYGFIEQLQEFEKELFGVTNPSLQKEDILCPCHLPPNKKLFCVCKKT